MIVVSRSQRGGQLSTLFTPFFCLISSMQTNPPTRKFVPREENGRLGQFGNRLGRNSICRERFHRNREFSGHGPVVVQRVENRCLRGWKRLTWEIVRWRWIGKSKEIVIIFFSSNLVSESRKIQYVLEIQILFSW